MTSHRLERIHAELKKEHLDALVITALPHVRYLTNFSGSNALCIIKRREAHFITDVRYALQSGGEVKGFQRIISATGLLERAAQKDNGGIGLRIRTASQCFASPVRTHGSGSSGNGYCVRLKRFSTKAL